MTEDEANSITHLTSVRKNQCEDQASNDELAPEAPDISMRNQNAPAGKAESDKSMYICPTLSLRRKKTDG